MQKRRASAAINGGATAAPVLPVTEADAKRTTTSRGSSSNGKTHLKPPARSVSLRVSDLWSLGRLLIGIVGLGLVVVIVQRYELPDRFQRRKQAHRQEMVVDNNIADDGRDLPLTQFTSLSYPLRNSQLVGLYYAASWCPQSTPVTNLLDETFRDILPHETDQLKDVDQRIGFSLVYVSSDKTEEEMKDYMRPNWMAVPYDSPEKDELKKHFRTCAKIEIERVLGTVERKHEIPTLIIVSGTSHEVLTFHGANDVKEYGAQAIDHWLELDGLSNALASKYE